MSSKKTTETDSAMESKSLNRGLGAARSAKQDEFYTQYFDIQKEVDAYLEFDPNTFRGKVVYCNCDDPFESNFFKYFAANFNKLGLKRLVTTSYIGSPIAGIQLTFEDYFEGAAKRPKPKAMALEIEEVKDLNGDGSTGIEDVKLFLKQNPHTRKPLKGGGDFLSAECVELLKQADIVVTNPPFSLFRQFVAQLVEHGKKFLIIGNTNSVTYKEIFPLIKENKLWLGCTSFNVGMFFEVPDDWERFHHIDEGTGKKIARVSSSCWYTNLDHGRRHSPLNLMSLEDNLRFSKSMKGKSAYVRYANYDAIDIATYKEIPSDYDGVMGVPITFLDKHNPEQFEILGITKTWWGGASKTFSNQIQVGKDGEQKVVSKLNDAPAIKVAKPPTDQTYYIVDGDYYIALYQRILIRRISRPRKTKK